METENERTEKDKQKIEEMKRMNEQVSVPYNGLVEPDFKAQLKEAKIIYKAMIAEYRTHYLEAIRLSKAKKEYRNYIQGLKIRIKGTEKHE